MKKHIDKIISPPSPHMVGDGFKVHTFFPSIDISKERMSPFFLLDYNKKIEIPPSDTPKGVGVHPHRGFETVTISFHGKVAHHDSYGNSGVIEEGDVQWMTAGSGILHKEYHEKEFSKKGGLFQMVQLWVNLPAKDKMSEPKYQPLLKDDISEYKLPNNSGTVNIIAGEYNGKVGPAKTFTPMNVLTIELNKDGIFDISLPEEYNTTVLVVEGEVKIDDKSISENNLVLFKNSGNDISIKAKENSKLLLLSGEPLNEPIAQYGPFLMNTQEEINVAINDFSEGKFGYLED